MEDHAMAKPYPCLSAHAPHSAKGPQHSAETRRGTALARVPSHLGEVPKGGKGGYTVLVCFQRQGSHYINQVGLELIVISLPLPPKFLF